MAAVSLIALATLGLLTRSCEAADYKQATPPMGWNTYNYYSCNPSEKIVKTNAQGLVDLGLADLGYNHVTPDCGWQADSRDADGNLQWNATLFPSGGKALGDFLHGLGLKFGIYSGAGYYQCGSTDLPGSLGHEEADAQSVVGWGGDSLKYDNCYSTSPDTMVDYYTSEAESPTRFQKMAEVLASVDRDIEYYICQWGVGYDVGSWAAPIGNTWRMSNDIYNAWRSIWRITNEVVPYWKHTTVGAYADMDMLIVGLGALSYEEERFHFGMWAINKSPLIIGAPMNSSITPAQSLNILKNTEVIALNQDPLGKPAQLVRRYTEEQWDIWAGELSGSRTILAVANWNNNSQTVQVDLGAAGVSSATARDVWAAKDLGTISGTQTLELAGHELRLLVLSDIVSVNETSKSTGYHGASSATFSGDAGLTTCNASQCEPTGNKVTSIYGTASKASFSAVNSGAAGTKLVGVDFVNYDIALDTSWDWGDNARNMTIAVNGGSPKRWEFPISGGDWYESGRLYIEVAGFVQGSNTVVFSALDSEYAPDLVGFEVYN